MYVVFGWNFVRNLRLKICPKSFLAKPRFVKSIPGHLGALQLQHLRPVGPLALELVPQDTLHLLQPEKQAFFKGLFTRTVIFVWLSVAQHQATKLEAILSICCHVAQHKTHINLSFHVHNTP
jgi:hypothetical protein